MLTANTHKVVMAWIVICLLVPPEIRIAGVTVLDFCVYSTIAVYFIEWVASNSPLQRLSRVESALFMLLCISIASCTYNNFFSFKEQTDFVASLGLSTDFLFARLTLYGIFTIIMLIGGYRIVASSIHTQQDIESLVKVFIGAGMLNAIITIAFWAVTTGGTFERYNYIPPLEGSQGIHLNYMSMVFLFSFAVMASGNISKGQRLFVFSAMALTGFSMLTAMVRQGWVMCLFSLIIYFILIQRKQSSQINRRLVLGSVLFVIIGLTFLVIKNQEMLVDLFADIFTIAGTDEDQGSWLMRFALIQHGLELFLANPLFGIGFGHYPAYSTVPIYITGVETFVSSPHNGIVTIAAETGIPGLCCLFMISFYLLRDCNYVYNYCSSRYTSMIVAGVFSLLIINVVSQFISNSLIIPLPTERSMTQSSFVLWILFGLVAGIGKMATSSSSELETDLCH
jgi:hypothetical protein